MNDSAESRPLTFGELGVPGPLVRVLAADDKKTAFPIQADTLPDSLAGRDILGRGRTGSGKTLAFSIPLATRLGSYDSFGEIAMEEFRKEIKRRKKASLEERRADDFLPHPRGLVLAPTRELANQINDVLMPLAHTFGMNTTTVYGGVKYIHQIRDLKAGADIVVACPGRLEDLLRQQALTLSSVEVVVIDAGHGGKFPGAHYGGVYEKDLTLKVALKLGKLVEEGMPGVKVVYTRTADRTLGADLAADLQARADIANKAGGDLFISIHANAAPRATGVRGVETLIMGESSKEQRYNENALFENNREDLIDMSDERTAAIVRAYIQNLQFTYGEYSMAFARCIQNSYLKAGRHSRGIKPQLLRVLYATDMPGVLTEIGFMSNQQELAYMKSDKGQNEIARSLYQAIRNYSVYVLGTRMAEEEQAAAAKPAAEQPAEKSAGKAAEKSVEKPAAKSAEKTAAAQPAEGKTATAAPVRTPEKPAVQPLRYTIQVMASASPVPLASAQFRAYRGKVKEYAAEGRFPYKYGVGEYGTREAAQRKLAEVRKVFPGAFVVACRGTQIVK